MILKLRVCQRCGGLWKRNKQTRFKAPTMVRCPVCDFNQRRMERNIRLAVEATESMKGG